MVQQPPAGQFLRGEIQWSRYEQWGPIQRYASFEKWWKDYGRTLQNPVVREVTTIPEQRPPNTIYLEIPLNRSPRRLAKRAFHIIESRIDELFQARVRTKGTKRETYRRGFYGSAWFTEGRDIRVEYYETLLDLYEKVFRTHPRSVGVPTLRAINGVVARLGKQHPQALTKRPYLSLYQTVYTMKHREFVVDQAGALVEWGTPEDQVNYLLDEVRSRLLNLRRAKYELERVVNAVARGEFPGPKIR